MRSLSTSSEVAMHTSSTIRALSASRFRIVGPVIALAILACQADRVVSGPFLSVGSVIVNLAAGQLRIGEHTQATVIVKDPVGATISGLAIKWASSNANVASVNETGVVTALAGGTTTISASTQGVTGSAGVIVLDAPVVATKLAITTQPSASATTGQPLAQQPVIQLQDANGAAVSQAGVVVSVAIASGGGTLSGTATATTNASGAATFSNLAITGSGAQTLQFTAPPLTAATSNVITVSVPPPVATKLAITRQPSATATSGQVLAQQPIIQLQDANSGAVSQAGVVVSVAIASGGGTLSGTTTATTNASGAAPFSNLAITGSGAQTLQFTAPTLTAATSNVITVSVPPPVAT